MRPAPALLLPLVASCGTAGAELPVQDPQQVVDVLTSAARACSAPLAPGGSIDEAALSGAGWRQQPAAEAAGADERSERGEGGGADAQRPRTTEWSRSDGPPNVLHLTRYGAAGAGLHDECIIDARTHDRAGVDRVVAGMTQWFGRAPDRQGEQPRGGDFLTPRTDAPRHAYHWALPTHDAYLSRQEDRFLRLVVVAMADRASLDRTSPDHPESRIPTAERPQ